MSPGRRCADKHATRNARGPGTASVAERVPRAQAAAEARRGAAQGSAGVSRLGWVNWCVSHPVGGFHCSSAEPLPLMAHVRIILKMDRNQDDAQVQLEACNALCS